MLTPSTDPQDHSSPSVTMENTIMSLEGHNGNLQQAIIENREGSSVHLDPSGSPIIPAVDLDAIVFEISRASDKTINADAEMACSIINPDAPQSSSQLNDNTVMVWDDHWHLDHYANLQLSVPETENMSMAGSGSENGISVFRTTLTPVVHETTSLHQIIDLISKNHEVKDPQPIFKTSSNSAFDSFRKRGLDNSEKEQSNKSAKTTPEDWQLTDSSGRITSTSASQISQKPPSKSNQTQR